jgi:hypothetical protein
MPFQPINFAGIEPQGNPLARDLITNLMTGYKLGQMPGQMRRQAEQEQAERSYREALAQEALQKLNKEKIIQNALFGNQLSPVQGQIPPRPVMSQQQNDMGKKGIIETLFPQIMQKVQQQNEQQPQSEQGNLSLTPEQKEYLRRVWFGLPTQMPSEKTQADIDEENRKLQNEMKLERFKAGLNTKKEEKSGEELTPTMLTNQQEIVANITNLKPMLSDLISLNKKGKVPYGGLEILSPEYTAKTSAIIDTLIKAYNYMGIKESIKKAENQIERKIGESDADYGKRLLDVQKELNEHEKNAREMLRTKRIPKADTTGSENDPFGVR